MEVYYYIPIKEKEDALCCGIKLSTKANRKAPIHGYDTSCISMLLNPKDHLDKYKSDEYTCLGIEVKPGYCFIADSSFYGNNETENLYIQSIMSQDKYVFGKYRKPECLVTCTILPDNIREISKVIDYPLLYNNSEDLYVNYILQDLKEKNLEFNDTILGLFFDKLYHQEKLSRIENHEFWIYTDTSGSIFTIKKPEIHHQIQW